MDVDAAACPRFKSCVRPIISPGDGLFLLFQDRRIEQARMSALMNRGELNPSPFGYRMAYHRYVNLVT